jgi:carbon storage regulator
MESGTERRKGGNVMLVLTRRQGEEIIIAGNIRITVVAVKGGQVRIGITAPPSVSVDRQEIHERRHDQPAHVLGRSERTLAH